MKKLRIKLSALIGVILISSNSVTAQNIEMRLQRTLDSTFAKNQDAIGVVIHVEAPDQGISWTHAVGVSDTITKQRFNEDQAVLIASNTKTYIAASILKLEEKGAIGTNQAIKPLLSQETIEKLIQTGYDPSTITVKQLLSHTSGITDYVTKDYFEFINNYPQHRWTREEQIELAMSFTPTNKIEKNFDYADVNYLLLTEIIEQQYGKPFFTALRELLEFEKHGLNHTWFTTLENEPKSNLPLAHQYSDKHQWDSYQLDPSWDLYGGGGLATNAKELALFFQLLFEGKIIQDQNTLSKIYTSPQPNSESSNYCLGLYKLPSFSGHIAYYHGGWWGTDVMYLPEINTTISAFTLLKEKRGLNPAISKEILKLLLTE